MPLDIKHKIILLLISAGIFFAAGTTIFIKRRKMPLEVWIPLFALCATFCVGLLFVAICLAAIFST